MFLAHVALKIFVFTVPGFVGYFASLGLPAIVAYGTIALELLGGIALILGIYVSWVALPLAIEVLGTIVLVHGANGCSRTKAAAGNFPRSGLWVSSSCICLVTARSRSGLDNEMDHEIRRLTFPTSVQAARVAGAVVARARVGADYVAAGRAPAGTPRRTSAAIRGGSSRVDSCRCSQSVSDRPGADVHPDLPGFPIADGPW